MAKSKRSLVHAAPNEATVAAGQIEQWLATGESQVRQAPWTDLLQSWSAVADPDLMTVLVTME